MNNNSADRRRMTRGEKIILGILIILMVGLAMVNSFIQDDAFISFRYAYNLVHHQESTWNPGEKDRVEGYTNFL